MSRATSARPHKIIRMVPVLAYGSSWLGTPVTQIPHDTAKVWVDKLGAAEWGSRCKSIRLKLNRLPEPQLSLTMSARGTEKLILSGSSYLKTLQGFYA